MRCLASACKEMGVELRLGTAATQIIKGGGQDNRRRYDGTGWGADEDRLPVRLCGAQEVTRTTRSGSRSTRVFDLDTNLFPVGNVDKTGDGIRMAWEVGAAAEGMGVVEMYRIGPMGPDFPMKSHLQVAAVQPDLWVDYQGERFCDEAVSFNDTAAGNVNARHKEGYTFTVLDDSIKQTYDR